MAATPGVATRISTADPPIPTSQTSSRPSSLTNKRYSRDGKQEEVHKSKLSRLDSVKSEDEREDRGRQSPMPRARTPGEMDYSILGGLQLGTLVVTNGIAYSPTPSIAGLATSPQNTINRDRDMYNIASEGDGDDVFHLRTRSGNPIFELAASPLHASASADEFQPIDSQAQASQDDIADRAELPAQRSPTPRRKESEQDYDQHLVPEDSASANIIRKRNRRKSAVRLANQYLFSSLPRTALRLTFEEYPESDFSCRGCGNLGPGRSDAVFQERDDSELSKLASPMESSESFCSG